MNNRFLAVRCQIEDDALSVFAATATQSGALNIASRVEDRIAKPLIAILALRALPDQCAPAPGLRALRSATSTICAIGVTNTPPSLSRHCFSPYL